MSQVTNRTVKGTKPTFTFYPEAEAPQDWGNRPITWLFEGVEHKDVPGHLLVRLLEEGYNTVQELFVALYTPNGLPDLLEGKVGNIPVFSDEEIQALKRAMVYIHRFQAISRLPDVDSDRLGSLPEANLGVNDNPAATPARTPTVIGEPYFPAPENGETPLVVTHTPAKQPIWSRLGNYVADIATSAVTPKG